jgi:hypothetical protein
VVGSVVRLHILLGRYICVCVCVCVCVYVCVCERESQRARARARAVRNETQAQITRSLMMVIEPKYVGAVLM